MVTDLQISWRRIWVADALLIASALLLPALSHLLAFPLYRLNPMLLLLVVGLGLSASLPRRGQLMNGLLLALSMPLLSALLVGMPSPLKAFCMCAELATVALLLCCLPKSSNTLLKIGRVVLAFFAGKLLFYGLKSLLLAPAVLVTTSLSFQLVSLLAVSVIYLFLTRKI